jgi:hypothetical protein
MNRYLKIILVILLGDFLIQSCGVGKDSVKRLSSGKVVDQAGKPIPRAVVSIGYASDIKRFTTDKNGIFRVDEADFSAGNLSIKAKGYSGILYVSFGDWDINANKPPDYKFILYPERLLTDSLFGFGTLEGRVTDIKGEPIAGAYVKVSGFNIAVNCDRFGTYKLPNIPTGRYDFWCATIGYNRTSVNSVIILPDFTTHIDFILSPAVLILPPIRENK